MKWMEHAACRHHPPQLFFPQLHDPPQRIIEAKQVCQSCPVQQTCRLHAATFREVGIWGGELFDESRKSKKRRQQIRETANQNFDRPLARLADKRGRGDSPAP